MLLVRHVMSCCYSVVSTSCDGYSLKTCHWYLQVDVILFGANRCQRVNHISSVIHCCFEWTPYKTHANECIYERLLHQLEILRSFRSNENVNSASDQLWSILYPVQGRSVCTNLCVLELLLNVHYDSLTIETNERS